MAKRRSAKKGVLDWWQTVLDETKDLVDDGLDRLRDNDDETELSDDITDLKKAVADRDPKRERKVALQLAGLYARRPEQSWSVRAFRDRPETRFQTNQSPETLDFRQRLLEPGRAWLLQIFQLLHLFRRAIPGLDRPPH